MAIHGEHYSSETGRSYHTEQEREAANAAHSGADGSKTDTSNFGMGGAMGGVAGFFLVLFLIFGKVADSILGFIFGILFKLGIVGKVIQSVIVGFLFGSLFVGIPLIIMIQEGLFTNGLVNLICFLAPGGAVGFWYFRHHYDTVRAIPSKGFVWLVARSFSICFYGTIVLSCIGYSLVSNKRGIVVPLVVILGFYVPLAVSCLYWFIKTKPFKGMAPYSEADEAPLNEEEERFAKLAEAAAKGNKEAVKNLEDAVEDNPERQLYLANIFFDGTHGFKKDKQRGIELTKKAADKGHAVALNNLALYYYEGDGVKKDKKKAFEYYKKSAEGGYAEAQYVMAMAYAIDDKAAEFGVTADFDTALSWIKKSAAQGFKPAVDELADLEKQNG